MSILTLSLDDAELTIHRLPSDSAIPEYINDSSFLSITRTSDELSIVCESSIPVESETSESGWRSLKVLGPLDFSLTGILAGISACLAASDISIFAVSTFDTDYILVKSDKLSAAIHALQEGNYNVDG